MAFYLDPNELLESYQEALKQDVLTDRLAKNFMLICVGYAKTPKFIQYQPKDELYSAAWLKFTKSWNRIKEVQNGRSIFAFLTTMIHRTYLWHIIEEQKYHDRFINMGLQPDEAVANMDEASEFIKKNGGMQE